VSRLHAAVAYLAARLQSRAGVSVTYTRDAGTPQEQSVQITAIPGQQRSTADPNQNQVGRVDSVARDYVIRVADLPGLVEQTWVPRSGDRVIETIAGIATTFVVTPTATEACWRYTDQTHTAIRVHTQPL
jgi:hypothetical protein